MKTLRELGSDRNLTRMIRSLIDLARQNLSVILSAIGMGVVMLGFYLISTYVPPGAVTFCLSLVSLSMVIVTALARVNDIAKETGWNWSLRRLALIATGASAVGILLSNSPPTWENTMLHMGIALTWFTTPGMPPWWKYIAGKTDEQEA